MIEREVKGMRNFSFLLTEELFARIKEAGQQYQRKPGQEIRFVLEKIYSKEEGQKKPSNHGNDQTAERGRH